MKKKGKKQILRMGARALLIYIWGLALVSLSAATPLLRLTHRRQARPNSSLNPSWLYCCQAARVATWQPYIQEGLREEFRLAWRRRVRRRKGGAAQGDTSSKPKMYIRGARAPIRRISFFPFFFTQPLVKLELENVSNPNEYDLFDY